MKPQNTSNNLGENQLFQSRLDQILDPRHPLFTLALSINWQKFETDFGKYFVEYKGRPGLPIRLVVGLHYLKYAYNVSDERVVEQFVENPYWQYFCGFEFFQHRFPCDPTSLTKWRNRIGVEGVEKLLKETIATAQKEEIINEKEFTIVNVDTTVQEKAVSFPTDARLYHKARITMVRAAKKRGIQLRQTYRRVGKLAFIRQGRYSHAKQPKRARRETKKLLILLGRVVRDIRRKKENPDTELELLLQRAEKLLQQKRHDKNKLYSFHAPEVECIAKGKAHKKYEFGCKVSIVSTNKNNWVIGIDALHGNPYDAHTLKESINQAEKLSGVRAKEVYVDQGYKGIKNHPEDLNVNLSNKSRKNMTITTKKKMNRRNAIEPIISHIKFDHRLDRNFLKGRVGDQINALLAGAGFNLRKLLRAFFLFSKFFFERLYFFVSFRDKNQVLGIEIFAF